MPTTTCSYEVDDNLKIFVPVTINGKTFRFLFDTGTNETLINYETAKQLDMTSVDHRLCELNSPDTFFVDSVYYLNSELFIQGMSFSKSALCLDKFNISFSRSANYEGYDGILGNRDIKKKNWLFDFKNKKVTLSDTMDALSPFINEYDQVLELKINDDYSALHVDMCVEDSVCCTFLFDTGWGTLIELNNEKDNYKFYSDFAFRDSFIVHLSDRIHFPNQAVLLQTFKMNDMLFKHLSASVNLSNIIKENVIAVPFLRRFEFMLYDSDNQKICLFYSEKGHGYKGNKEAEIIDFSVKKYLEKENMKLIENK